MTPRDSDPRPRTTLAIILGASRWPNSPKLGASDSFRRSATEIGSYFSSAAGLALPPEHVLDLFDTTAYPTEIGLQIRGFLADRVGRIKTGRLEPSDLLVYYTGHGGFVHSSHDYYLALQCTFAGQEGLSSLRMADLAKILGEQARFMRKYLILDCCFAGSAYPIFQSAALQLLAEKTFQVLPKKGTSLLCSSSARDPSLAPEGELYTMFSGALIETLQRGIPSISGNLSLEEVGSHIEHLLRQKYPDTFVRPEVLSPEQGEGDIATLPLFPNFAVTSPKTPAYEPRRTFDSASLPEGPLDATSPYYFSREQDRLLLDQIAKSGHASTIVIKGPRKVGKTSLLFRAVNAAIAAGKIVAFIDFQEIDASFFEDKDLFFSNYCRLISAELGIPDRLDDFWNSKLPTIQRCGQYVGNYILKEVSAPVVVVMDEVERVFDTPFRSDFFGMLRGWHGRRERPTMPSWKRLSLVLVTSTEPHYFITNSFQSPFNVASDVLLSFFPYAGLTFLNDRYGGAFARSSLEHLFRYTGGHPYLTHWAIYCVALGLSSEQAVFADPHDPRSPFRDHLFNLQLRLNGKSNSLERLKEVLRKGSCSDIEELVRLQGAGLIKHSASGAEMSCEVYKRFFEGF